MPVDHKDFQRPNPDDLLHRLEANEKNKRRGKLKIFFGACPGVGKTYAMLLAAHALRKEGVDVVVGIVETHKRPDTEKLLEPLPIIPALIVSHRDITLRELDLNAAKARRPDVLLVDELAHTNAPDMRHPKRWNDVEELLDAGIDVYTTLNVQHIESLSDIVAGTTGVLVREVVPDAVFDHADDIILIDINIDELLKRLHEGNVYVAPEIRNRAKDNFFKARNLVALREMALRRTAERVDAQMYAMIPEQGVGDPLPVADRIMVCIGPDALSTQLVRTARRMATSLKSPWVAVYVENMRHYRLPQSARRSVQRLAQMAERMGGKVVTLQGDNVVDDIITYAKANRVTKIIIGKPIKPVWKTMLSGSLADKIIRKSGYMDVYVVTGKSHTQKQARLQHNLVVFQPRLYVWTLITVAALTSFGIILGGIMAPIDQAMVYLTGIVFVAAKFGRGPSFLYSLLGVSCFNFFFIPPLYTFNVYDRSYWLTFAVMLITGFVITDQASRLRLQAVLSRKREHDTQTFYALTRQLASTRGHRDISNVAAQHINEMFDVHSLVSQPDKDGQLQLIIGRLPHENILKETSVLRWCYESGQISGRHTTAMPSAKGLYFPLVASSGILGVLGVLAENADREFSSDELSSLDICASLLASALERANIAEIAETSKIEIESERLRTTLLSSVSHDLRTPLASITGASSTIVTDIDQLPRETIRELGRSINKEAERLSRLVTNLLEVTRFESGAVRLNRQPYFIDELIGSALGRLELALADHHVIPQCEESLPLILVDGVLIEQVLINLLENAVNYTPLGSTIRVSAETKGSALMVSVTDNGPGILPGNEALIFDKFYSIGRNDAKKGTGLGLAICAAIIKAHHGALWAENQAEGGAGFYFTLPLSPSQGPL